MNQLKDVLQNIQTMPESSWVYLSDSEPWKLDSKCLVLDPVNISLDMDDDESIPEEAKKMNMMEVLSVQQIQDIVINAKMQDHDISIDGLYEAFLHYFDNDTFIILS